MRRTITRTISRERRFLSEIAEPDEEPYSSLPALTADDMEYVDVMRSHFEHAREYFKSLESLGSLEWGRPRRSTSLRAINVSDKFSLDSLYEDVMFDKARRNFMGRPKRAELSETLASVSSTSSILDKDLRDEDDDELDLRYFHVKKRKKERRSVKSLFDVNY